MHTDSLSEDTQTENGNFKSDESNPTNMGNMILTEADINDYTLVCYNPPETTVPNLLFKTTQSTDSLQSNHSISEHFKSSPSPLSLIASDTLKKSVERNSVLSVITSRELRKASIATMSSNTSEGDRLNRNSYQNYRPNYQIGSYCSFSSDSLPSPKINYPQHFSDFDQKHGEELSNKKLSPKSPEQSQSSDSSIYMFSITKPYGRLSFPLTPSSSDDSFKGSTPGEQLVSKDANYLKTTQCLSKDITLTEISSTKRKTWPVRLGNNQNYIKSLVVHYDPNIRWRWIPDYIPNLLPTIEETTSGKKWVIKYNNLNYIKSLINPQLLQNALCKA